jgi:hypothetical protein
MASEQGVATPKDAGHAVELLVFQLMQYGQCYAR